MGEGAADRIPQWQLCTIQKPASPNYSAAGGSQESVCKEGVFVQQVSMIKRMDDLSDAISTFFLISQKMINWN